MQKGTTYKINSNKIYDNTLQYQQLIPTNFENFNKASKEIASVL